MTTPAQHIASAEELIGTPKIDTPTERLAAAQIHAHIAQALALDNIAYELNELRMELRNSPPGQNKPKRDPGV